MSTFVGPVGLTYNRGLVGDVASFADEANAESWLFLCGEAFGEMPGGMTFEQVQAAVGRAANVVSDPPQELTMELAREQVAALDALPRPTVVTCRMGPRASALVYLYSGLRDGAAAEEVLAHAEAAEAPFVGNDELRAWVAQGLDELR